MYVVRVKFSCNVLHPIRTVVRFLVFASSYTLAAPGFSLLAFSEYQLFILSLLMSHPPDGETSARAARTRAALAPRKHGVMR